MKIGLVVALYDEVKNLYDNLGEKLGEDSSFGFKVEKYAWNAHELYLLTSGVGEIHAALAAQLLAVGYGVSAIINFGVVGALNCSLKSGDVVIADEIVHYDFTASCKDLASYGYYLGRDYFAHKPDTSLFDKSVAGVKRARIASGDKFVNDSRMKNWLVSAFSCDICDMESAGILFAAETAGIPLLLIKSVSDGADENADADFKSIVEKGVETYISLIHKILSDIDN